MKNGGGYLMDLQAAAPLSQLYDTAIAPGCSFPSPLLQQRIALKSTVAAFNER